MLRMGFGSYDESEQGSQDTDIDEDATVTRENDHDGDVNFDSGPTATNSSTASSR